MTQWQTPVEDQIWIMDDFLPEYKVDELLEKLNYKDFITIGETVKSKSQVENSTVLKDTKTLTDFSYNVHGGLKVREDFVVRDCIAEHFSKIFPNDNTITDFSNRSNELWPLQLFMKSHGIDRRYSIHNESDNFGNFSFMIFLDEVDGCDLVFPSEKSLPALWEKYPIWKAIWEKNLESIPNSRYLNDFRYTPKRNQCIIFRSLNAHYVDEPRGEYVNKPGTWRHAVQGWPWVDPEFQKRMIDRKSAKFSDR